VSRLPHAILLLALWLAACRPVTGTPARGFVELKDDPNYDFRAVAPEGVAVAARVVKMETPNDVAFWEHAVSLRMREMDGYALTEAKDTRGPGGMPGRELVFGHDEEGKPFVYRVRLFVVGDKLLVVEAGGSREQMKRLEPGVEWMLGQLKLR
jgi:hypothetical protein